MSSWVHPQSFQWIDWDGRSSRGCKDGLEEMWSEVWSLGALRCPSRSLGPAVQQTKALAGLSLALGAPREFGQHNWEQVGTMREELACDVLVVGQ